MKDWDMCQLKITKLPEGTLSENHVFQSAQMFVYTHPSAGEQVIMYAVELTKDDATLERYLVNLTTGEVQLAKKHSLNCLQPITAELTWKKA